MFRNTKWSYLCFTAYVKMSYTFRENIVRYFCTLLANCSPMLVIEAQMSGKTFVYLFIFVAVVMLGPGIGHIDNAI